MMNIPPDELALLQELYDRGLFLQAHARAERLGPYKDWRGAAARVFAGRLGKVLGATRLSNAHHYFAWREHPEDPQALYFYALSLIVRRDPWRILKFLRAHGELEHANPDIHSSWIALHATTLARVRDFEAAETWMRRAEKAHPDHPWLAVEWAEIYEIEDRIDDALAAAKRSLEMQAWYRPGIHAYAHLLTLKDRLEEATAFLEEAARHNEAPSIWMVLAGLHAERQRHRDALACYDRYAVRAVLQDEITGRQLAAMRCDAYCMLEEFETAAKHARLAKTKYYTQLAERLEKPDSPRRKVALPVGFVRQHHLTCAPATFAALADFWKIPIDHLQLAQQVTYDGTPSCVERAWAEDNGWIVREFTVTLDSARALLDRGIPFTLHTADVTSGHAQAVIGYDELRGTFQIRDPNIRHYLEFNSEKLLENQRASGPHGMVLLPERDAAKLDGVELPDQSPLDRGYRLQRALLKHDREAAWVELRAIERESPGHRLAHLARLTLAAYDEDRSQRLAAYEELLKLFPDHARFLLGKLDGLRDLARPTERVELLARLAATHEDPVFAQQYAEELRQDTAQHTRALELLHRANRRRPYDALTHHIHADLLWSRREYADALDLYRMAVCLDDKNEHFVEAYFLAARHLKKTEDALRFLRDRVQRYGKQSSQPLRTLFWALEIVGLPDQGFDELDMGFKHRHDDAELMLFAAEVHARYGHFERAEQFLRAAKGKCRRAAWLRSAAELEGLRSDPAAALELWKLVADIAPLDLGAQRALAQCLAETQGRAASLEHLRALAERFPHHLGVQAVRIEWMRQEPAQDAEPCIRHMSELDPQNVWARQQLAWNLYDQRRLDEAFAEAEAVRKLNPSAPACTFLFGSLCQRAGRIPEARAAFKETLMLSVEETGALARLMEISDTPEERQEAILFFYGELVRQVTQGDGLLAFRQHARGILSDEEILAKLREAHASRPDLWHSWSALVRQFLDMDRAREALETAREASERFPLMARVWLDRANACRANKDESGEIDALQQAYQIGARWGAAARQLADAYSRKSDWAKAREMLEAAAARDPLDPANHGMLAEALWNLGEKEAALARIERAVLIEPGYEWAWSMLRQWSEAAGQPQRAAEGARALAQRRPGEARSWLVLAKMLAPDANAEERLTALDQALKLNPRIGDAHDLRAETLAALQRWEDALAACKPTVYGDRPPLELRGRAAWIKAEAGRLPDAITDLRALLAEAPEYAWGWYHLVRWLYRGEDNKAFLDAAETFARLDPASPLAQGYLGDARLRAKDRAGAKAAFERAIAIDPNYSFSFSSLFDMKLEDNNLDGARDVLAQMPDPEANPSALTRAVRLAAHSKDESAALAALRKLAESSAPSRGYLDDALHALEKPGWARQANKILEELAEAKDAPPFVAEIVVERLAKRRMWAEAARLASRLLDQGEAGARAASELLSAMAEANARDPLLNFIEQHRHPLHLNTVTWGYAGYALATVREYGRCIHWLNDWSKRAGVEPWMLSNLALAQAYLGQYQAAAETGRGALALPADHTTSIHGIWVALHESLEGNTAAAEPLLKNLDAKNLKPFSRFLLILATVALEAAQSGRTASGRAFESMRSKLAEARRLEPKFQRDSIQRGLYLRCLKCVAQSRGGLFGWLWYAYYRCAA